jgi:hypothetical protein
MYVMCCLMPFSTIFQLLLGGLILILINCFKSALKTHIHVAQTLSYNVALSTPRLSGIRIHNFSDDRNRLHIGSCKSNIQEEEYILDICIKHVIKFDLLAISYIYIATSLTPC